MQFALKPSLASLARVASPVGAERGATNPSGYRKRIHLAAPAIVGFALIAGLVQARALTGLDLAAARAKEALLCPPLDVASAVVAILFSSELSLLFGAGLAALLWRAGWGRWSLAPFAFLLSLPIEIALKLIIAQSWVPAEFYRSIFYPLATLTLQGTFPSGHAIRVAFFGTFGAILLRARGGSGSRLAGLVLVILVPLLGLSRVYLGYHWLSDVVAGLLLGSALALLATPPRFSRRA